MADLTKSMPEFPVVKRESALINSDLKKILGQPRFAREHLVFKFKSLFLSRFGVRHHFFCLQKVPNHFREIGILKFKKANPL